jgi:hypothetical protein
MISDRKAIAFISSLQWMASLSCDIHVIRKSRSCHQVAPLFTMQRIVKSDTEYRIASESMPHF